VFSYFKNGISDINPKKIIDFPTLIKTIKNNSESDIIEEIRQLRKDENENYKVLKNSLPIITPNCILSKRNLKDQNFEINFTAASGYIYFDIDNIINLEEYKKYFIEKYGNLVSIVSKSISCGGISILFKLTNNITTKDQFFQIWDKIRTTILKEENIDNRCKDIGRSWSIPYDPDVYYNYDNEITVEILETKDFINEVNHPITYNKYNNRVNYSFSNKGNEYLYNVISIDIVLKKLIRKTMVFVSNAVFDFKPIEYAEVYIPKVIKDGTKHNIYTAMIHQLVFLNPLIEKEYIFSFLFYINNNYAKPKMNTKELIRLFDFVYDSIKITGKTHHTTSTKWVHFNSNFKLTGKEKNIISNKINGLFKRHKNINKIISAKQEIVFSGFKINQKNVANMTGLCLKTVQKYFNSKPIDMDDIVKVSNKQIVENYSL
jgi:hypothetical protein